MQRIVLSLAAAISLLVIAAALFLVGFGPGERPAPQAALAIDGADIGGPFTLVDHTGATRDSAEVIDGPTLIYFGYTFCPDVCPIDSQIMAEAVDLLAEQGVEVTPVFVTVDPVRDTPTELGYYVEALHPDMVGLTGSEAEVKTAADAYKVYYSRVEVPESRAEYLMNHTAYTYLMMPDGIAALYRRGASAAELAADVARVLAEKGVTG